MIVLSLGECEGDTNAWIQPRDLMRPPRTGPKPDNRSSDNSAGISEQHEILLRRRLAAFGLSSLLFLVTLLWTSSYDIHPSPEPSAGQRPRLQTGIDPNTARWFELAQLPGIGEALGRRMEDYRRRNQSQGNPDAPVFRAPADLAQVKGIGEKTVRRMGPFLRFPESGVPR